jgi:hypothetical protein
MERSLMALWCLVFGVWCFVFDAGCPVGAEYPTPNTKHQTPNTKHQAEPEKPKGEGKPSWLASATVEELIEHLTELKAKRAEAERQIKEALTELTERVRQQEAKLAALGLRLEPSAEKKATEPTPKSEVTPKLPPVAPAPDEFQQAYDADKALNLAGAEECRALANIYALAGASLDRVKLATVGHFRQGIDVQARARLKNRLPSLYALAQRQLLAKLPADDAVFTPQVVAAAKMAALGVAQQLERLTP